MDRPLAQLGIDKLEELFAAGQTDAKRLKSLAAELECRSTNRAAGLLSKVNEALAQTGPAAAAGPRQTELGLTPPRTPTREDLPRGAPVAPPIVRATTAATPTSRSAVAPVRPAAPPKRDEVAKPTMDLAEAARVLGVKTDASWELVEQARCKLVDPSRPKATGFGSEEENLSRVKLASRANEAYQALVTGRAY